MSSLHQLLSEEGFGRGTSPRPRPQKQVRFRDRIALPDESIILPIHICHGRKSFVTSNSKLKVKNAVSTKGSSVSSSKRGGSDSGKSNSLSVLQARSRRDEPAIEKVATKAVISILSGYVGKYSKDSSFRESVREKCYFCFARRNKDLDNGIFTSLELGIESAEKLVLCPPAGKKEVWTETLSNSIRLLSVVASLNSTNGSTCGIPNPHLSACAQLYLSIVYKMEKNDRISTRHLLQVFCDAPFLARTHLIPELWEHFFLPHLLHLKIWYGKETESLCGSQYLDKEERMKTLSKVYNDQMDMGTTQFALYYMERLKVGAQKAPAALSVSLPSRHSYGPSTRRSLDSSAAHPSINKSLYQAVFGPQPERMSMDLDEVKRVPIHTWDLDGEEKACAYEDTVKECGYVKHRTPNNRQLLSRSCRNTKAGLWPETQKIDYLRVFPCRSEPAESVVPASHMEYNISSFKRTENTHLISSDVDSAITIICSSESLSECEMGIRVISKAWLDFNGDSTLEKALSKVPVIEGMLEVLCASSYDEVLELTISLLAELITRNEAVRHITLNSDPQLEIFMRLLRSRSLFLKAAILLHLVKPKAKQMISSEWVPLVLRVLEFGDQLQTLFSVRNSPYVAAYYFLDQLLTGFDQDKNLENGRQIVSVGGLNLLVRRIDLGDISEKNHAASIILYCIRADGSCRHFLVSNLRKGSVLQLLVLGNRSYQWHALTLFSELLCLNRRTETTKFLHGLLSGWHSLNTMHILFIHLQRAHVEERPIVASLLLQLDLLSCCREIL